MHTNESGIQLETDERYILGLGDSFKDAAYPVSLAEDLYYLVLNSYSTVQHEAEIEVVERLVRELGRLCQDQDQDFVSHCLEAENTCPALSADAFEFRNSIRRRRNLFKETA